MANLHEVLNVGLLIVPVIYITVNNRYPKTAHIWYTVQTSDKLNLTCHLTVRVYVCT